MKHHIMAFVATLSLVAGTTVYADNPARNAKISSKRVAHEATGSSGSGLTQAEIMIIVTAVAVGALVLGPSSKAAGVTTTAVSDARLKTDITRTGTSPSGIPIYTYRYGSAPERYSGVLAQDLVVHAPDAIVPLKDGYLAVDYSKIDVNFALIP